MASARLTTPIVRNCFALGETFLSAAPPMDAKKHFLWWSESRICVPMLEHTVFCTGSPSIPGAAGIPISTEIPGTKRHTFVALAECHKLARFRTRICSCDPNRSDLALAQSGNPAASPGQTRRQCLRAPERGAKPQSIVLRPRNPGLAQVVAHFAARHPASVAGIVAACPLLQHLGPKFVKMKRLLTCAPGPETTKRARATRDGRRE